MRADEQVAELLRDLAPRVLGPLVRRYGDFARCEDAVQEALIAALESWPGKGVPAHPLGWLSTVATRRYVDRVRSDSARARREVAVFSAQPRDALIEPPPDAVEPARDDTLELLFLCCHPALTTDAQLALTLRAVGGLTTGEIAAAFLVPEKTMGQRISRAKAALRAAGARFVPEPDAGDGPRLRVVLHVLYLIFNEGYSASGGDQLHRPELTRRAVVLTRRLHARLPGSGETAGLLALMLLTDARAAARTGGGGVLIPLAEQDRRRWDDAAIREGTELITATMASRPLGPYQVQAAIAALHSEAPSVEATDWPQILALYGVLERLAPNPVTTLNRAVALGMVAGPRAGLDLLAELEAGALAGNRRLLAVRAHLLDRAGLAAEAATAYRDAARTAGSTPERRFLLECAARCESGAVENRPAAPIHHRAAPTGGAATDGSNQT